RLPRSRVSELQLVSVARNASIGAVKPEAPLQSRVRMPSNSEPYRSGHPNTASRSRVAARHRFRVPQPLSRDLGRTCTTGMAGLGIAPHVADRVLNHQSGTISGVALSITAWLTLRSARLPSRPGANG